MFLLVCLLWAEYWNYQRGSEVTLLCSAIEHVDVLYNHPNTPLQEAQNLCALRDEDDYNPEDQ